MEIVYLPVYKTGVGYSVSYGRRWSVLEHLLLGELSAYKRTIGELVQLSNLPERLVVESVVNLLRTAWVEVRSTDNGAMFNATALGRKIATELELPAELKRKIKGISLCVDRLNCEWFRSDDLNLVNQKDLPLDAIVLDAVDLVPDMQDPAIRNLLFLNSDESLDPMPVSFRGFSNSYARVEVGFGTIQSGLPSSASLLLKSQVLAAAGDSASGASSSPEEDRPFLVDGEREELSEEDIIVGGAEHFEFLIKCLQAAKSHIIIHSCFVSPKTLEHLLPHFAEAARAKVRVDLMWGWHNDPEEPKIRRKIAESEAVLNKLDNKLRGRVQLSPSSTGSHAKLIAFDQKHARAWKCVVSSCNFLSSEFDWIESSIVLSNQSNVRNIVSNLLSWLIPASDEWSPFARRIQRAWQSIPIANPVDPKAGQFVTKIIRDREHYTAVTMARDISLDSIIVGCDLYGLSAEISVLVPMEAAAGAGKKVQLLYSRPSRTLIDEGRTPDVQAMKLRGICISQIADFHAKFILFDDDNLVVSSFNWMSTVGKDARARSAEIGVCIKGPGLRQIFLNKLRKADASRLERNPSNLHLIPAALK